MSCEAGSRAAALGHCCGSSMLQHRRCLLVSYCDVMIVHGLLQLHHECSLGINGLAAPATGGQAGGGWGAMQLGGQSAARSGSLRRSRPP